MSMFLALQIVTIVVVAIAMSLALAHALELPGKLRLGKEQYLAVQPIYYPGFTYAGAAEPAGLLLTLALMFFVPRGLAFWLTAGAFAALVAMHAIYWLVTHPVNNFWLKDVKLSSAGAVFFGTGANAHAGTAPDWTTLRDRWEFSHVARAVLGLVSVTLLAAAVAVS
jgi:hypothetical protein